MAHLCIIAADDLCLWLYTEELCKSGLHHLQVKQMLTRYTVAFDNTAGAEDCIRVPMLLIVLDLNGQEVIYIEQVFVDLVLHLPN